MCSDESECSSLSPDLHDFKCICAVIAKDNRDSAIVYFPRFFLDLLLLNLTGAVALLLVELDDDRWYKHIIREMVNGRRTQCAIRLHTMH